ncbi:hypothetical protein CICLE_v10017428mg [Citrus x clementina]|uniref:Uncharacterized protein n=1 Tax=Citrus clementina TaxID=85681 RepID=V4UF17_CITCL|nr:hypothetical protein CICLE_v10017428mg [Citrus x clementina]
MEILDPEQIIIFPDNTGFVILLVVYSIWSLFSFSFIENARLIFIIIYRKHWMLIVVDTHIFIVY